MADFEKQDFGEMIRSVEQVEANLRSINTESNLTIVRHKTLLVTMVSACGSLIDNLRIIEQTLRTS